MVYVRTTKDVWKLIWNGEVIDTFDTLEEASAMRKEYELAYHSAVSIKAGREKIEEDK